MSHETRFPKPTSFLLILAMAVLAGPSMSQTPPAGASNRNAADRGKASIRGVVRQPDNGPPIAGATVGAILGRSQPGRAITDDQGRYEIEGLEPGLYRIQVQGPRRAAGFPEMVTKRATVPAEGSLTVDIELPQHASISGRVVDQNGEPLPGAVVATIGREYMLGEIRYVYNFSRAEADDQGNYVLDNVRPDNTLLLMASVPEGNLGGTSEAPRLPQLRRPAYVPTYYPGTPVLAGALPVTLRSGEKRQGVDFRIERSSSYCLTMAVQSAGAPKPPRVSISMKQPSSGLRSDGASYSALPSVQPAESGNLRVCGLHPGDYVITAEVTGPQYQHEYFSKQEISVGDRDLDNIVVTASPIFSVPGEAVWESNPPAEPLKAQLDLYFESLTRTIRSSAKSEVPGKFLLEDLVLDEYRLRPPPNLPPRIYLRDIRYGGDSIMGLPFKPGTAIGDSTLKVVMAHDGGKIKATVQDEDDKAAGDVNIVIFPADVTSEPRLAHFMVLGNTDQNGAWTSETLQPGKYRALATTRKIDYTPESIGRLLRSRTRAKEIDLNPNADAAVALTVMPLE